LFSQTVEGGSIECLLWLRDRVPDIDFANQMERDSIVMNVAVKGHVHMLEWLQDNLDVPFSPQSMDQAAGESLKTVVWFHRNRPEGCTTDAMDFAAAAGLLDVVEWLSHNRDEGCTKNAMDMAAANGHLAVVKWLDLHRKEGCTKYAMDAAAENGRLEVVEWLHLHREEGCSTHAMDQAAVNRFLHVVVWLHENRMEGCSNTVIGNIFRAASQANGEAEPTILDFLLEHYPEKCQCNPGSGGEWIGEQEFYSRAAAAIHQNVSI
jgi:hypothetical protein